MDKEIEIMSYYSSGVEYLKAREYEKALKSFDEVIKMCPFPDLFYNKGMAHRGLIVKYLASGFQDKAMQELQYALESFFQVISLDPEDSRAYYNIGACLFGLNQADCIDYFRKTVELEPNDTEALHMLALALFCDEQDEEALSALKIFIQKPNPCIKETNRAIWLAGLNNLEENNTRAEIRKIISGLSVIPDFLNQNRKTTAEIIDMIDQSLG